MVHNNVLLCILLIFCDNPWPVLMLSLEPAGVLYVCSGGAPTVNCSTSSGLLVWDITFPRFPRQRPIMVTFEHCGILQTVVQELAFDFTTLNISLTNSSPLIQSTISFDNATAELNGSLITCSGDTSATVQLDLVENNGGNIDIAPTMNISEHMEANSVTVNLEWSTKHGVAYIFNVEPKVAFSYTGRHSAQLVVPYNSKYKVSVIASLCGYNRTTFSLINYVKCPQPASDNPVIIEGYRFPAIEGTTITLRCSTGLILTGSTTATCKGNGEWEPNLKGTMCKVDCQIPVVSSNVSVTHNSTLEGSLLTFQCKDGLYPDDEFTARCYSNRTWIPNPSGHVCATSLEANCGDPSPPSDGYLQSYTSTSEGSKVKEVHVCQNSDPVIEEIVCTSEGEWESVNNNVCVSTGSKPATSIIIGASMGSCFGVIVLCCVVLAIIIIIIKYKGSKERNVATLQKSNERTDDDHQGEYSLLQRSFPVIDHRQTNSTGEYSLLQYPDTEKQLETCSKDKLATLVYADVMSFKQNSNMLLSNPTETRVEYAELNGNSSSTKRLPSDHDSHNMNHSYSPVDQAINLDNLLIQLKSAVTDKWYEFGEAIGVHREILEKYTQYPSDQSLIEILDHWLRNHSGQPTWNEISEGLTKINLLELALNIKSIYQTGQLPIEVDMNALPDKHLLVHHLTDSVEELPPPIPPRQI